MSHGDESLVRSDSESIQGGHYDQGLARYASHLENSRGRRYAEAESRLRTAYQRDRDRIIHSAAFRRLEHKTQVFINPDGDMFRTRLTHSLEVSQIARTVGRALALNEDLIEAICLAHDLGHTPFGHAGQLALNDAMRPWGGFEHNLQSLRIVDALEQRYPDFSGLNLTFETREGILKHCSRTNAALLGSVAARFLTRGQPSLEAQVANICDEIAYNHHDIDDGLRAGLISVQSLEAIPFCADAINRVRTRWPNLGERPLVHEMVRGMIGQFVEDLVSTTQRNLSGGSLPDADAVRAETKPLVTLSTSMDKWHYELKAYLHEHLYQQYQVHRMARKSQRVLRELFEAFIDDVRLLPEETRTQVGGARSSEGQAGAARVVADYLAGMTDRYALAEHARVFNPLSLS